MFDRPVIQCRPPQNLHHVKRLNRNEWMVSSNMVSPSFMLAMINTSITSSTRDKWGSSNLNHSLGIMFTSFMASMIQMDNSCVPYPPMFPRQSERLLGDRHLLTIRATSPIGLPRFTVFPLFLRFSFLESSTGLESQFSLPSTIWAINGFGCSARVGFTKA